MPSKNRGHCDNIKVFNQGKSNQIREKSGNLIAKNVWSPCLMVLTVSLQIWGVFLKERINSFLLK